MKRSCRLALSRLATAVCLLGLSSSLAMAEGRLAVYGNTVYPVSSDPILNGVIYIDDGKILAVGAEKDLPLPRGWPTDVKSIRAEVITPGLIDAHTVVGLAGQYNYHHDQDQLERSKPIQPQLRAIDAFNVRERLVEWVRSLGVTTIHTGHGPGEVLSGQTMVAKTAGNTTDSVVMVETAALAVTFGQEALKQGDKTPGTRSKIVSLLRQELLRAQEYLSKKKKKKKAERPDKDLRLEALGDVLGKKIPLLITAHRAQDIANALRLANEFGIRIILDGGSEAYLLLDEIRDAKVPVIVHPTMARTHGEKENLSLETAAKLADAGIPIALQSGYESYVPKTRVVLFEAAIAAANGLGFDRALHAITLGAAQILGIDGRVGSLEKGKDADLALYDGDPFEYTTHCITTILEGEVVSSRVR